MHISVQYLYTDSSDLGVWDEGLYKVIQQSHHLTNLHSRLYSLLSIWSSETWPLNNQSFDTDFNHGPDSMVSKKYYEVELGSCLYAYIQIFWDNKELTFKWNKPVWTGQSLQLVFLLVNSY